MKVYRLSPLKCVFCGSNVCYDELPFCCECISELQTVLTARCISCGKTASLCECSKNRNVRFAFFFGTPSARRIIYHIKNGLDIRVMDFFAELVIDACGINPKNYDGIAYVPRSKKRKRFYGYDQSAEFAKALSRKYGVPVIDALERIGGKEQKLLSRGERLKNILNNFRIKKSYDASKIYNKILLVDDVCTTGATIEVCAGILRGRVAKSVVPLTLSKTVLTKK